MLPNNVKLVIWDLDDTFWSGTLAEGEITPIKSNHAIVIALAERGIISSICSKNNHDHAMQRLEQLDLAQYFVFPKIEFGPKGHNIAAIIETAGLRPENVLFVDDNLLNLEEARRVSPGLMTAEPSILPTLLEQRQLAGKDDRALTRLKQYKNLEIKALERTTSSLSHEDFLRDCAITVEIDYEVEKNLDRIIELANRTNQLNFTKKRLETEESLDAFKSLLTTYGVTAGLIRVTDKYGDYGVTGYFVLHRHATRNDLIHFAFSCRTMNMGIEQYIYERLKNPNIKIAQPVANPIVTFSKVDWITEAAAGATKIGQATSSKKLLLLGGCELLQIASMCSSNREEFVNTMRDDWPVRFDDVGFILSDRNRLRRDKPFEKLNYWNYQDAITFDRALATSDILIVALFNNMGWNLFESDGGNLVRITDVTLKKILATNGMWFVKNFRHAKRTLPQKLDLISKALNRLAGQAPDRTRCFTLGVSTKKMPGSARLNAAGWPGIIQREPTRAGWLELYSKVPIPDRPVAVRHLYNRFVSHYCSQKPNFKFIDIDAIVTDSDIIDDPKIGAFFPDHFGRRAYIAIATHIAAALEPQLAPVPTRHAPPEAAEIAAE